MQAIKVGCAGWSIPRQSLALFGEGESMLARYATRFPVVEVNSSFYRPHKPATYVKWASSVPRDFRFSVKLPKMISHELALRQCGPVLDRFLGEAEALGGKLGGFLLQLPPSHVLDARVASTFFRLFRRRSDAPLVCEPRHASWFSSAAEALLQRYDVGRVGADPALVEEAGRPDARSPWPYWRWHGSPRMYYSAYTEDSLQQLAAAVVSRKWPARPWVIFDNTAHGHAVANAARLQDLLRATSSRPTPRGRARA
jgi:uncharacterized protein YecE (DUF72 family)